MSCFGGHVLFVSVQAEPIRVVVTGAAGQIAYSLLYSIAKGDVFGKDQVRPSPQAGPGTAGLMFCYVMVVNNTCFNEVPQIKGTVQQF